ncbi:TetR/AcrR family transcriptional regulator [Saccharibacillus deserti]|uniref:TetR/AcrR family transcriptional regulator n=1 Tax=Saccharibacillus deserti TaxID=1634444 RepID=UPI001553045C|nr:TetR/AcrR family transcriptional regulator [Saccharibacillus deserti]
MTEARNAASPRRNRTKEHFKAALIELIKSKGYHAVTVKDIVDTAAYNRSTFYVQYQDKPALAEDLLIGMLQGLEDSVGKSYVPGNKVYSASLDVPSFNILTYIYKHRDFFELIQYEDTLPGLHTAIPRTFLKIYMEQFTFETIDNRPVDMDYFKRYTAYGFYGLIMNWIAGGFRESQEDFIKKVIDLTRTHIYSFRYTGQ